MSSINTDPSLEPLLRPQCIRDAESELLANPESAFARLHCDYATEYINCVGLIPTVATIRSAVLEQICHPEHGLALAIEARAELSSEIFRQLRLAEAVL